MIKKIKIIAFSLIALSCFTIITPKANAMAAWPDIIGLSYKQMMEEVSTTLRATLLAALKQAALQIIVDTVNNAISGVTQAGSLFIQDWEDYLFKTPQGNASAYMNDFFTITTRGKSSGSFASACGGTSFSEWRAAGAIEGMNVEIDFTEWQSDFEEYACGAINMFEDKTWEAYNKFMEPNNNPIAYELQAQSIYQKKLEEEKKSAEAQAIAYGGFIAQKENGMVITPGSLIEGMTISANTIDNIMLANADDVAEMASAVAGKIASTVIKQGVGMARQAVQNKINENICSASQSLRDQLKGLTPNGSLMGNFGIGSLGSSSSGTTCRIR